MCLKIKTLTGGGDKHRSGAVEVVVVGAGAGVSIPQGPRSDDAVVDGDGDGTGLDGGSDGG